MKFVNLLFLRSYVRARVDRRRSGVMRGSVISSASAPQLVDSHGAEQIRTGQKGGGGRGEVPGNDLDQINSGSPGGVASHSEVHQKQHGCNRAAKYGKQPKHSLRISPDT